MNNLIMNYDLTITSTNFLYQNDLNFALDVPVGFKFELRLAENGVQINESINSYTNTMSIHIPKTSPYRRTSTLDLQSKIMFNDFNSIIKKGDKIDLYLNYQDSPLVASESKTYQHWNYIVNEVIIHSETVELKCFDMMFFLINSFIEIKDIIIPKKKGKGKKEKAEIFINIKEIGELLVETANKKIEQYNTKISKFAVPIFENLILKIPNELNFNMRFTKGGRLSCVEVLKILEKDYLMDSQIITKDYLTYGRNGELIEIQTLNFLEIGTNWNGIKTGTVTDYTKHYFSDIPQKIIENYKIKKPNFTQKYNKIINRENLIYQQEDNVSYRVTATVFDSNSTKTVVEAKNSDAGGEKRDFIIYNNSNLTDEQISLRLDNFLAKLKYNGFKQDSSFTTFGLPRISPNSVVCFDGVGSLRTDSDINDQIENPYLFLPTQYYYVSGVETSFDKNGWRQKVYLKYNMPGFENEETLINSVITNNYVDNLEEYLDQQFEDIQNAQFYTRREIEENFKKTDIEKLNDEMKVIENEALKVATQKERDANFKKMDKVIEKYWNLKNKLE